MFESCQYLSVTKVCTFSFKVELWLSWGSRVFFFFFFFFFFVCLFVCFFVFVFCFVFILFLFCFWFCFLCFVLCLFLFLFLFVCLFFFFRIDGFWVHQSCQIFFYWWNLYSRPGKLNNLNIGDTWVCTNVCNNEINFFFFFFLEFLDYGIRIIKNERGYLQICWSITVNVCYNLLQGKMLLFELFCSWI